MRLSSKMSSLLECPSYRHAQDFYVDGTATRNGVRWRRYAERVRRTTLSACGERGACSVCCPSCSCFAHPLAVRLVEQSCLRDSTSLRAVSGRIFLLNLIRLACNNVYSAVVQGIARRTWPN